MIECGKRAGWPVSVGALVRRINRRLAERDQCLKKARGEAARQELGDYYLLNVRYNCMVEEDVDPESLGRELGVLGELEAAR